MKILFVFQFIAISLICISCISMKSKESEKDKLLQTDWDFARTSEKIGAAEAFKLYLDHDALMLSANQHPIAGRDTIYQQMLANDEYTLSWEPQDAEVASSGDLGYTWGKYTVTAENPDGAATYRYGNYLNVWKKQPAGSWKVLVDMGNASPDK